MIGTLAPPVWNENEWNEMNENENEWKRMEWKTFYEKNTSINKYNTNWAEVHVTDGPVAVCPTSLICRSPQTRYLTKSLDNFNWMSLCDSKWNSVCNLG